MSFLFYELARAFGINRFPGLSAFGLPFSDEKAWCKEGSNQTRNL